MFSLPKIVGTINVTPDSFSGDGLLDSKEKILEHAESLIENEVSVIDIGAESTRPGAKSNDKKYSDHDPSNKPIQITHEEEWDRLNTILNDLIHLTRGTDTKLSVDTRNAKTAESAINLGVNWINDVSAGEDPKMFEVIARSDVKYVIMHSLGIPPIPKKFISENLDAVEEVSIWFTSKLEQVSSYGIDKNRIIIDPGIGFGKTARQCIDLLKGVDKLRLIGNEILVGHSRKLFFNLFTDVDFKDRDVETAVASIFLGFKGVDYVRVHNVSLNQRALKVAKGLFMEV